MRKFSPRELVKRAAKRYSTARGVVAARRRRAHADGLVTAAEARAIREGDRRVADALALLQKRKAAAKPKRVMRRQALEEARELVGTREVGGNNVGPVVSKIIRAAGGTPGEPWCGDFVAYCYLLAGSTMVTRAWAYVPTLERVLMLVRAPLAGHVVIYRWQHTGLFDEWIDRRAGTFWAIEGNTGVADVSDAGGGEGVERKVRNVRDVHSFRRVVR